MKKFIMFCIYATIALFFSALKKGSSGGSKEKSSPAEDVEPGPPPDEIDAVLDDPPETLDDWVDSREDSVEDPFATEDTGEDEEAFSWKAQVGGEEVPVYIPDDPIDVPTAWSADHDHIPSTALSKEKRLEQLERLKDAGLLDDEEYKQKKREIKRGE